MSLDGSEPVDSTLMFPNRYDSLEYSWVKATAVSMRLRILLVMLQNTNKLSGTVAGERQLHYLRTQSSSYLFPFLSFYLYPRYPWSSYPFPSSLPPMGKFSKPSPSFSSSYELDPGFIAMVRKRPFSGAINDDPLDHLREFEKLCSSLVIPGMTQEILR